MKRIGRNNISMMDCRPGGASEISETSFALGRQIAVEYYQCDPLRLLSRNGVKQAMMKAAEESGATIVKSSFHMFEPQGVSGVVIIAESHFSIHTWPEYNYAAVDLFTCGNSIDFDRAIQSLKTSFASQNTIISSDQSRGIIEKQATVVGTRNAFSGTVRQYPVSLKNEIEEKNPWAVLTSIDVYGCKPAPIKDAAFIKRFVGELCSEIGLKTVGECTLVSLGDDPQVQGFFITQMGERGLISGHVANPASAIYMDIFSCSYCDPRNAAEFTVRFFKASNYTIHMTLRH